MDSALPPFANAQAREAFRSFLASSQRFEEADSRMFELRQRISQMDAHSANVADELRNAQHLV